MKKEEYLMTNSLRRMSIGRLILYVLGFGLAVIWLAPLVWMIVTAVKPAGSAVTVMSELFKAPFTLAGRSCRNRAYAADQFPGGFCVVADTFCRQTVDFLAGSNGTYGSD
jgi:ABC-type glycerol-3-phosphate transport system permease component